jgi:hypothetical protein
MRLAGEGKITARRQAERAMPCRVERLGPGLEQRQAGGRGLFHRFGFGRRFSHGRVLPAARIAWRLRDRLDMCFIELAMS